MTGSLRDLISRSRPVAAHQPWPRVGVGADLWRQMIMEMSERRASLLGLWGEPDAVHMAVIDDSDTSIAVLSLDCPNGSFPSVGAKHPPAIRFERTITDLWGLIAEGALDQRPWLDHGRWSVRRPLGTQTAPTAAGSTYDFLPVEGESLHQIGVGPVHAGIIEPGHFRFTANGEAVVRLEERLGYVHRGLEGLMIGATLEKAVKLASRASGDSTVAYGLAFAHAVEAALRFEAPPRAHWLRALMAELERLANHLGDIGAICNDASFSLIQAHCAILRERVLRSADICFGHRLMRDVIAPGGVIRDLEKEGSEALRALVDEIRRRLPTLVDIYDNTASLQDRTVGTGILKADLARQFAAGGYIGRASGRAFDARRATGYAPYDVLRFDVPVLEAGDVNARVWIRIREVEQSLSLVDQLIAGLPGGAFSAPLTIGNGPSEGMAIVEGFRGDVLVWLRLANDGKVVHCHLRDPSWFQWPLLEAAIEGNIVADFPLCNKSFNCSYAGHDL